MRCWQAGAASQRLAALTQKTFQRDLQERSRCITPHHPCGTDGVAEQQCSPACTHVLAPCCQPPYHVQSMPLSLPTHTPTHSPTDLAATCAGVYTCVYVCTHPPVFGDRGVYCTQDGAPAGQNHQICAGERQEGACRCRPGLDQPGALGVCRRCLYTCICPCCCVALSPVLPCPAILPLHKERRRTDRKDRKGRVGKGHQRLGLR